MSWNPGGEQILLPRLQSVAGGFTLISGTAYFLYFGYVEQRVTAQYVVGSATITGAGAQTAEIGLFSSTVPPNKGNITLATIVATGALVSLTAVVPYLIRNNVAFNTAIPSGVYLWAGIRTAMAATQPQMSLANFDMSEGFIQTIAGSGVLTGGGPFVASIPALVTGAAGVAPYLRVELV